MLKKRSLEHSDIQFGCEADLPSRKWCYFGGGGSSSAPQQPSGFTQTTSTTSPWAGQQPYLNDVFSQANWYEHNYQPQYYGGGNNPGPQGTVAQFDPLQTQAIQ